MALLPNVASTRSVLIARQSSDTAENTTADDFFAIRAELEAGHEWDSEDFQLAAGDYGASAAPVPGRRHATIKLSGVLEGFKTDYDYTSDAADDVGVISPLIALLGAALGGGGAAAVSSAAEFGQGYHMSRQAYIGNDVQTGSTTTSVTTADQTAYAAGKLGYWLTDADDTSPTIGWIKALVAGPQKSVTLFEAADASPASGDDAAPTTVAYISDNAPVPLTIRSTGSNAADKWSYIGFKATRLYISGRPGETPRWEVEGVCIDRHRYSSGGGLTAPSAFKRIRPVTPDYGAHMLLDGSDLGITDKWELEVLWDAPALRNAAAPQGAQVDRRLVEESPIKLSLQVPLQTGDTVSNNKDQWENAFNSGTASSLTLYLGNEPGRIFAVRLASAHLAAPPVMSELERYKAYDLVYRAAGYSGDDGSTLPADAELSLGWG